MLKNISGALSRSPEKDKTSGVTVESFRNNGNDSSPKRVVAKGDAPLESVGHTAIRPYLHMNIICK